MPWTQLIDNRKICLNIFVSHLEKIKDWGECHVQSDGEVDAECKSSGWLWYDEDGIDDRVHDTGDCCNFEQNCGEHHTGIGEHVEQTSWQIWQDVLHVISMSSGEHTNENKHLHDYINFTQENNNSQLPSNSFNILISEFGLWGSCAPQHQILRVGECLSEKWIKY